MFSPPPQYIKFYITMEVQVKVLDSRTGSCDLNFQS